jgi:hypothetical protein
MNTGASFSCYNSAFALGCIRFHTFSPTPPHCKPPRNGTVTDRACSCYLPPGRPSAAPMQPWTWHEAYTGSLEPLARSAIRGDCRRHRVRRCACVAARRRGGRCPFHIRFNPSRYRRAAGGRSYLGVRAGGRRTAARARSTPGHALSVGAPMRAAAGRPVLDLPRSAPATNPRRCMHMRDTWWPRTTAPSCKLGAWVLGRQRHHCSAPRGSTAPAPEPLAASTSSPRRAFLAHPPPAGGTAPVRSSWWAASGCQTRSTCTPAATSHPGATRAACLRPPASLRWPCRRLTGMAGRQQQLRAMRLPSIWEQAAARWARRRAEPPARAAPFAERAPRARPPPLPRIQRVRALYNSESRRYVLLFGLSTPGYSLASVGFATSVSPLGPFKWELAAQPDSLPSYDVAAAADDDGSAYLVRGLERRGSSWERRAAPPPRVGARQGCAPSAAEHRALSAARRGQLAGTAPRAERAALPPNLRPHRCAAWAPTTPQSASCGATI